MSVALARALLVAMATAAALPAGAEPPGGYVEAGIARGSNGPEDGGERETGVALGLRAPLGERWFVTGSVQRNPAYVNDFGAERPLELRKSVGIGLRKRGALGPAEEVYAQLRYIEIDDWRFYNGPQRQGRGGALSFGARRMFTPSVEGQLEGGIGSIEGSDGGDDVTFAARAGIAFQLMPRLWAYAACTVEDESFLQAGVRVSFARRKPRRAPAVQAADGEAAAALAVGSRLKATRALQLQARPAFGAPETIAVAPGGTIELLQMLRNEFGNWWRVSHGDQQGWIREGWLE